MKPTETIRNFSREPNQKSNKRKKIIDQAIALFENDEFFKSDTNEAYISLSSFEFRKNIRVGSGEFIDYFYYQYQQIHNQHLSSAYIKDIAQAVSSICKHEGKKYSLHNRMVYKSNEIYIDLGTDDWRVLKINCDGISYPPQIPIKFIRYRGMNPLPLPDVENADITALKSILNIDSDETWRLYLIFILQSYYKGPYIFINLVGTKGTAKTWTTNVLRNIIDPRVDESRSMPEKIRDAAIQAQNQFLLAFDNISKVSTKMSDFFCRLSAGGGHAERMMYKDDDEKIFFSKRPMLINGINNNILKTDLADRFITINLPKVQERASEEELRKKLDNSLPIILGGIYKCLSHMLQSETTISELPRMADAINFVTKAEKYLGLNHGDFLNTFNKNQISTEKELAENNILITSIEKFLKQRHNFSFRGQSSELFTSLCKLRNEDELRSHFWPKAPNMLTRMLNEYESLLLSIGISYTPAVKTNGSDSKKVLKLEILNKEVSPVINDSDLPF